MAGEPISLPGQAPGPSRWMVAVLAAAAGMVGLDLGAVGVALPAMAAYFGVGIGHASKVVVVYRLVAVSLALVAGALGGHMGYKRSLLIGVGLFTVGSLMCGLAPGMDELIVGRAVQGVGGALLTANGLALTSQTVPAASRGRVLGTVAMFTALGFTMGPGLGGFITHYWSWRIIFLLNLPVGIALVLAGIKVLPTASAGGLRRGLDLAGALLLVAGLFMLISGLDQAKAFGLADPRCLLSLAAGALCLGALVWWERRSPHPLADWSLLGQRHYAAGLLAALCLGALSAGGAFLLPFYLVDGRHLGSHQAGLLLILPALGALALSPHLGRWADRLGSRPLCLAGAACLVASALIFATVQTNTALWLAAAGLGLTGLGLPAARIASTRLCLSHTQEHGHGTAAGLLRLATGLGSLLGVVVIEQIFSLGLPRALSRNDVNFSQVGLPPEQVIGAFRHGFTLSLALAVALVAFALLARDSASPDQHR